MKLNRWEFMMMNNPMRAWAQKIEWGFMKRGLAVGKVGRILEIGCGRGVGADIALREFEPKDYVGIDLDERMIERARRRVRDPRTSFEVASATDLPFPSNRFDLALDFGILHHIPDFDQALREVFRVLKPGGRFLIEDLTIGFFDFAPTRFLKTMLDHPYEDMFTADEFRAACEAVGFGIERWSSPRGLFIFARLLKPAGKGR